VRTRAEDREPGAIDRDPTVLPPFPAAAGVPFEQESVCLHHAVDPLHIHRRAAFFAPPP